MTDTWLLDDDDRRALARWLAIAVGSLILAGAFSLLVVIARMPPFDRLVTDPGFFKRCLVVHVDLALVVWFFAFLAALYQLVPSQRRTNPISRGASRLAIAGVALLVAGAGVPDAMPVLSNYIPMIDDRVFALGLALLAAALTIAFLGGALLPSQESTTRAPIIAIPDGARVALRGAAIAFLLAIMTFWAATAITSRALPATSRAEAIAWGGGHVLQFASVLGMLAVWQILVARATGAPPVGRKLAAALVGVLVLPLFAAPLLAAMGERVPFTRLMQLGIFPVVLVFLWRTARTLERKHLAHPAATGFLASAALTIVGFVIGAIIHGSNTTVPGHYHASIGAVTVAYMTITFILLEAIGAPIPTPRLARLARWQPAIFGAGQLVFALGFTLAGEHGMARKSYGAEQHLRTPVETAGLVIMGSGGIVAIAGGLTFLWIVVRAWRARARRSTATKGEGSWTATTASIRSRS
jgi:hypothetical protein